MDAFRERNNAANAINAVYPGGERVSVGLKNVLPRQPSKLHSENVSLLQNHSHFTGREQKVCQRNGRRSSVTMEIISQIEAVSTLK